MRIIKQLHSKYLAWLILRTQTKLNKLLTTKKSNIDKFKFIISMLDKLIKDVYPSIDIRTQYSPSEGIVGGIGIIYNNNMTMNFSITKPILNSDKSNRQLLDIDIPYKELDELQKQLKI